MSEAIRTIVAGVADVDGPDPVLGYAAELARRVGATLHVVHSYTPPETTMSLGLAAADVIAGLPPVPLWNIPEETKALHDSITTRLRGQLVTGPGAAEARVHVVPGSAQHAVAEVAKEVGAQLVVVGAGHHRGPLGSTTEKTLREVPIPVLVMRRPLPAHGSRVLLTTDLTEVSRAVTARALQMVHSLFSGEGFACRCLYVTAAITGEIPPVDDAELERSARAELDAFLATLHLPGVSVEPVVRIGMPPEEIITQAAEWPADLVVMGTHGRKGVSRLLLGSVAENVVRHVESDALVIHTTVPGEG